MAGIAWCIQPVAGSLGLGKWDPSHVPWDQTVITYDRDEEMEFVKVTIKSFFKNVIYLPFRACLVWPLLGSLAIVVDLVREDDVSTEMIGRIPICVAFMILLPTFYIIGLCNLLRTTLRFTAYVKFKWPFWMENFDHISTIVKFIKSVLFAEIWDGIKETVF